MNTALIIGIIIYCTIAFLFNHGMLKELEADVNPPGLSPGFMKLALTLCSLFWPMLLIFAFFKREK